MSNTPYPNTPGPNGPYPPMQNPQPGYMPTVNPYAQNPNVGYAPMQNPNVGYAPMQPNTGYVPGQPAPYYAPAPQQQPFPQPPQAIRAERKPQNDEPCQYNSIKAKDHDYEVFISYRHVPIGNTISNLLYDRLSEYGINTFRDSKELHFGDFSKQLVRNNKRSRCLVLLLTPNALKRCKDAEEDRNKWLANKAANPDSDEPEPVKDWITTEVSLFLKRRKPIVPVVINPKTPGWFPTAEDLPEALLGLLNYEKYKIEIYTKTLAEARKEYGEEASADEVEGILPDEADSTPAAEQQVQVNTPDAATRIVAERVHSILRKKWKPEHIREAKMQKQNLSRHTRHQYNPDGYFYQSALAFRKHVFLLIPYLVMVFTLFEGHFHLRDMHPENLNGAICGLICMFLVLFEFPMFAAKKTNDDFEREQKAFAQNPDRFWENHLRNDRNYNFVDLLLDHPISQVLRQLKHVFWAFPFFFLGIVIGFIHAGIAYLHGFTYDYTLNVLAYSLVLPPAIRMGFKVLFSGAHFVNSMFTRYPAIYRWKRGIKLVEKIAGILGWLLLVAAIVGCSFLPLLWTQGGAI